MGTATVSQPRSRGLRAKPPLEQKRPKPKILIFGRPAVGKTWSALDFPGCYFIDTEGGARLAHYQRKLLNAGGSYMGPDEGSNDFENLIEQLKLLATIHHDYHTVVIDSFTKIYATEASIAEEKVGSDYGKDRKEANKPTRRVIRAIDRLDMNVILICHEKDKWENINKQLVCVGQTFDAWDKLEYELDLCLRITKQGNSRKAYVSKSRLEQFPDGETFDWSYDSFSEKYGRDVIEGAVVPIEVSTPEQLAKITHLVEILRLEEQAEKWLTKAGVDEFSEMDQDTIQKCISFCEKKVEITENGATE